MKKGLGILTAALLTTSVYSQSYDKPPTDPTDLGNSQSSSLQNDDYRSRQSEAGAPGSSQSGNLSGYERSASSTSSDSTVSSSSDSSATSNSSASTQPSDFSSDTSPSTSSDLSAQPSRSTQLDSSFGVLNRDEETTGSANWDLSGGESGSSLRGDNDLNRQFDRSNNGYNDLDEPDMIYEEWIITEPNSVGAPASTESGTSSSDDLYKNDHSRTDGDHVRSDENFDLQSRSDQTLLEKNGRPEDQSDYFGTDIPHNSGAAATAQSGSESSDMNVECFDENDAQGKPADSETGYNEESRDRSNDGVAESPEYHINRGQDGNEHVNRSDDSSVGSAGSDLSGSASSSDNDAYGRELQNRVRQQSEQRDSTQHEPDL